MTEVTVSKSVQPRSTVPMMPLTFIAMDDWVDKVGEKSFILWMKIYTKVDRTGGFEEKTVKYSQKSLAKSLNMSYSTMLRLLKPLYEYGLIDYIQYPTGKGNVAENIIIHTIPQNKPELAFAPLEKCREWEQRTDERFNFTKQGGRPKKEEKPEEKKEEPKKPAKKEVPLNETIERKIEQSEDLLIANNVDIEQLKNWIRVTSEPVPVIVQIIENLATYHQPITNLPKFIATGVKMIKAELETQAKEAEDKPSPTGNIPFFNWLDLEGQ
ncbi:hypothetical protein ABEY65_28230 [Priestia aryabhattai]|uniref:hypothetical protein n=1 Tax=Priestia aryabhattai TaxID=412384 RepID=UPI003D2D0737